ncbi:hypothetical protein OSTOST_21704, partial [Ostertagia ostertagi]
MSDELTSEIVQLIAAARTAVGESSEAGDVKPRPIEKVQPNIVHIETIIVHSSCGENCSRAIPIELWTIRREWNSQQTGLAPLFLKNAIRSHLHFSQLNAWISTLNGRMPDVMNHAQYLDLRDDRTSFPRVSYGIGSKSILVALRSQYCKSERMPVPVGLCLTLGLKHKPRPSQSPPGPDGPSPKFSAIAGIDDERPARRVLSACTLSPQEQSRYDSHEIDILANRLQTIQGERGRQRTKSGGSLFNKITGLPLHSSPAPLSRQRNSLSASDIVLPETRLQRHQPGSLLGNFEESALNGRLDPVKRLDGFKLQL